MKSLSILVRPLLAGAAVFLLAPFALHAEPSYRTSSRLVFNEDEGRPMLFGGITPPYTLGDSTSARGYIDETWFWTGRKWVQDFHETTPPPRAAQVMVWDSNRDRVLLFGGGSTGDIVLGDTWEYDDGEWTQLAPPNSPPARRFAGYAFDPLRDRLIVFGGSDGVAALRDTWEFDGTTWTRVEESGPDVVNPILVYDGTSNEVLMLATNPANEVVMYRYTAPGWTVVTPAARPGCTNLSSMVWQEHNGKVLLVGGVCANGGAPGEAWEWDGVNWTKVTVTGAVGGVFGHAMTYDGARQETIVFGGTQLGLGERNDTYRFRDGKWTRVNAAFSPSPRHLSVFQGDPQNGGIWLYGGVPAIVDFWRFRNGNWTQVRAANSPGCLYPVGTYDSDRKRLILVCQDSAVHEFDGTTWTSFTTFEELPSPRRSRGIAYDPVLKRTVTYGGNAGSEFYRDTWTWNGTRWTEVTGKTAFYRSLPAMFYDPTLRKVVMYGGIGRREREGTGVRFGDTWSFNGTDWVEITSANSPPPRYAASVALDPTTNLTHMFGGKNEDEQFTNEHFVWNGTRWEEVEFPNVPSPRQAAGFTWDPSLQMLTLFGGFNGAHKSDVWRLTPSGWQPEEDTGRRRRPVTLSERTPIGGAVLPRPIDTDW